MTTQPRPEAPPPGLTVGGYELRARLGEGGMGVVHLAQRPGERPVALKVLRPQVVGDDEARRRLAREVGSLSRIRSRRIAEIVDADPWGAVPYVATRYVPGLTLHDHVSQEGPVTGRDLAWLADCLAEALQAVHAVGVLHRDVKPSNVILEGRTPILIDFGLARVADDPRLTLTGWLLGTPGYLAPEILLGEDATTASDVHSWAATVAFAGLGRPPFGRGPSMAVMDRVRRGEHDLRDLDPRLREVLEAALQPDPARRPGLATLRSWLAESAGGPRGAPGAAPATVPLAAAAFHEAAAPTRVSAPVAADPARAAEVVPVHTRVLPDGPTELAPGEETDPWEPPAPHRPGAGERLRRTALVLLGGATVAASVALAPYVTLGVVALLTWLLRSGSLAASSVGARRELRGARWYDAVQLVVAAPWHVLAAVPGTLVLVTWSLGIALAAALLCFAAGLTLPPSLAVVGAAFAGAMWWGPGSSRLRGPVTRVVHPLAQRPVPWLLAGLVVAAAASGATALAGQSGPAWTPDDAAPLSGLELPAWL